MHTHIPKKAEHLKGVYVLLINVKKDVKVDVGALGKKDFEKGVYAYVGSAQNGIEQRIKRHLKKTKTLYWHIDYLLNNNKTRITKIFYKEAEKKEECNLANWMNFQSQTVNGFGSSDCRCPSHLFLVRKPKHLEKIIEKLPNWKTPSSEYLEERRQLTTTDAI